MTQNLATGLALGARVIPVPMTISEQGRQVLSGPSRVAMSNVLPTLRARDEGLPMPAAVVMMTPASDITGAGDTFETLRGIDPILPSSMPEMMALYAGAAPLDHPYLSPLFGDFKPGFPPTFLQSGTRDLLLSSTVRMHRKLRSAGIDSELHVFEAMPHGGFGGTPDDMEVTMELRRFLARHRK